MKNEGTIQNKPKKSPVHGVTDTQKKKDTQKKERNLIHSGMSEWENASISDQVFRC